jgi:3-oxoacyl-[acyl-carrier-protein] synthase-3
MVKRHAYLKATGSYLPEKVLSNADFERMVETTDEWILTRTGIRERRIAAVGEEVSHMGRDAALKAIEKAGIDKSAIDLILVATSTPEYLVSNTASLIQNELGLTDIPAFDLQAACSGYIFGISMAKAYIESGTFNTILLVAPEKLSAITDYEDRGTSILFGDGAAAAILSSEPAGLMIGTTPIGSDGSQYGLLNIPAGGSKTPAGESTVRDKLHTIKMNGKELFKHAVRRMNSAAGACLKAEGITKEEIDWLVPHQANIRIIEAVAKYCDIPHEKVFKTVHKYGNTSASSVGIALDELLEAHPFNPGQKVLLAAFGAGLTWGATLLTQV